MTEELISEMASRFLQWRLPDDFHPDGGITYTPSYRGLDGQEYKRDPVGTNLFTHEQAKAMIRHMIGETT